MLPAEAFPGFLTFGLRCRGSCCSGFTGFVAALLVVPGRLVVGLGRGIEAGEQAVFRQLESVLDDERGVGVVDQILVRNAVVLRWRS